MKKRKIKKKTLSSNTFKYTGDVTVKVYSGDKCIKTFNGHNAGTNLLFEYYANCLVGSYNFNKAPRYIRVFHGDTAMTDAIIVSSAGTNTINSKPVAQLTFNIPYSFFINTENQPNKIALYSYDTKDYEENKLAEIDVTNAIIIDSNDTTLSLIIVWNLGVSNTPDVEESEEEVEGE